MDFFQTLQGINLRFIDIRMLWLRLKKGDRYFYDLGVEADTRFTDSQLNQVDHVDE